MTNYNILYHTCQEETGESALRILSYLRLLSTQLDVVAPSIPRLAVVGGVCPRTAARIIKLLKEMGAISYRSGKKLWQTNIYIVNDLVKTPKFFHFLYAYLEKALKALKTFQSEYVIRYKRHTHTKDIKQRDISLTTPTQPHKIDKSGKWDLIIPFYHKKQRDIDVKKSNYDSFMEIKAYVDGQTKLKVTTAGIYELCIYPFASICAGFDAFNPTKHRIEPFKYICSMAWKHVEKHKLDLRRSLAAELKKQADISPTSSFYESVVCVDSPHSNTSNGVGVETDYQTRFNAIMKGLVRKYSNEPFKLAMHIEYTLNSFLKDYNQEVFLDEETKRLLL